MACLKEKPNYSAIESERAHKLAMDLGSKALLARLMMQHPHIIERLQRKQQEQREQTT